MGSKVTVPGCLRILREGPATAKEMATELGGNVRRVSAVMGNLAKQARVVSRPFHLGADRVTRETVSLWSLPEHASWK